MAYSRSGISANVVSEEVQIDEEFHKDDVDQLHQLLDENHLQKIHVAFMNEETGQFDQQQLALLLSAVAKLEFDEEKFEILFLKINIKR